MAPRQKTFELVPDAPQGLGGFGQHQQQNQQPIFNKPPMTTKQAKKLHRQANKGPKISKAEQRRIELMEQDRIRKEFEREKQQARARTARERKKAKEEKEKEERRRKGLPMVDVHPSQDVISRFIMRGASKKRDSTGATTRLDALREEDTDTATEAGSGIDSGDGEDNEGGEEDVSDKENQEPAGDPGDERTAKRPRLAQPEVKMPEVVNPVSLHPHKVGVAAVIAQENGTESYSRASSVDADDPINETLLEDQLVADVILASSRKTSSGSPDERIMPAASTACHEPINVAESAAFSKKSPPRISAPKPQELQRNRPPVRNVYLPPNSEFASNSKPRFGDALFKKPASPYTPVGCQGPAVKAPAVRAPSVPPKFKSSTAQQNHPGGGKPKFLPRHLQKPHQRQHVLGYRPPAQVHVEPSMPSSTQQYLLHHIDDILPSPSQEAAELLEVQIRLVGQEPGPTRRPANVPEKVTDTGASLAHKFEPPHLRLEPMPPPPSFDFDGPLDFPISTQELFMSSQEIRDIETPSKIKRSSLNRPLSHTADTADRKSPSPKVLGKHTYQIAEPLPPSEEVGEGPKASIPTQILNRKELCSVGPTRQANGNASRPREGAASVCPQGTTGPGNHPSAYSTGGHNSGDSLRSIFPDTEGTKPGDCPRRSSSHESSAEQPQVTSRYNTTAIATGVYDAKCTPQRTPPKKRMFGSSGPGAEVLVAMERSYQEARREEQASRQNICGHGAEASGSMECNHREYRRKEVAGVQTSPADRAPLKQTSKQIAEQAQRDIQLMGLVEDDFPDDGGLSPIIAKTDFTGAPHGRVSGEVEVPSAAISQDDTSTGAHDDNIGGKAGGEAARRATASQETDYGGSELDAAEEVLDFLEADTTWLDDDLDDGL